MNKYEIVVGLETHIELSTKSKIFCSCTTNFGSKPNTNVCPICLGMPGTLPVLNKKVVEYAIKTGVALNCEITKFNKFDRKNYFYPDLPKAYQISQLYFPICQNGNIEISIDGIKKNIGIHEIHMEEDAGKLVHNSSDNCTLIDYNRCGVPLLEIVTEPDFRSSDEVIAYLEKLRDILIYIGVSDCKIQEGSMRADVNVSVHPLGSKEFGTRCEIKNMSSFKAIHRAIINESQRQIKLIEDGKKIVQETRRWDENKETSFLMRSKENAQDYRYFPEPDLPPIEISDEQIKAITATLPELPEAKRSRYIKNFGLTEYDASILTSAKEFAFLFENATAICNEPKEVCNLIMGELMRLLSETSTSPENINISPQKISDLITLVKKGKINRTTEKIVFEEIFKNDIEPITYITEKGLMMLDDNNLISETIDKIIANNPKSIEDYKNGKEKAFGFLVGQTMKALKGKANPQAVNNILNQKLSGVLL